MSFLRCAVTVAVAQPCIFGRGLAPPHLCDFPDCPGQLRHRLRGTSLGEEISIPRRRGPFNDERVALDSGAQYCRSSAKRQAKPVVM